jgi:hypothetical protein
MKEELPKNVCKKVLVRYANYFVKGKRRDVFVY